MEIKFYIIRRSNVKNIPVFTNKLNSSYSCLSSENLVRFKIVQELSLEISELGCKNLFGRHTPFATRLILFLYCNCGGSKTRAGTFSNSPLIEMSNSFKHGL
jgi:hypothetical protein